MADLEAFDPEVFRAAGVEVRHLRGLVPVSRSTVSLWLSGKQRPSHFVARDVRSIQHALHQASSEGDLPLPDSVAPGRHRDRRITAIIHQYLQADRIDEPAEGSGTAA